MQTVSIYVENVCFGTDLYIHIKLTCMEHFIILKEIPVCVNLEYIILFLQVLTNSLITAYIVEL